MLVDMQSRKREPLVMGFRMLLRIAVAVLLTSGCVTDGQDHDLEVVEKSKEQAPAWCALDASTLHESETSLSYVEAALDRRDLPLAISQTQLAALSGSRAALMEVAHNRLKAAASAAGITLEQRHAELDRHVAAATEDIHTRHARVSDIYFERYRSQRLVSDNNPQGESYGVRVLIMLPLSGLDELLQTVAQRCLKSRDPLLRQLAQVMRGSSERKTGDEISH